ncbi:hypothetical protein [Methylobacterium aquaticum]|uniref:Uncharacterized protein n=1 Tax=Methylobacterium aquaticum TaxID=270351 RepID=A0A0C6G2L8_9HYPH|nr:hypothetical protein [Methylobacterium aquaticum]BAQ50400.1 hypothetical protein Maq22A_4p60235 [Methylobacterium aquaticum]
MTAAPRSPRALKIAVGAGLAVLAAHLAQWCGPDVEARLFPVLGAQALTDVVRTGSEVCFTWRFDKRREARAVDAGWTLRTGARVYPYQAVRQGPDSLGPRLAGALVDRPAGSGQWTRKCIALPPELGAKGLRLPFQITGFLEYETAATGRLWSVREETARVTVP